MRRRRLPDWSDTEQSPEEVQQILAMSVVSKPVDSSVKPCLKKCSPSPMSPATPRPNWSPFRTKHRASRAARSASRDRSVQISEPSKKSLEDLRALYGDEGIGGFRPTRDIYLMAKRVKAGLPPLPPREPTKNPIDAVDDSDSDADEEKYLQIKPKPRLLSPPPGAKSRSKSPPLRTSSLSPARGVRTASPISRHRKNRSPDTRSKPRFVDLAASTRPKQNDEEDEYEDVSSGASTPERVNPPVLPFTALDPSVSSQLIAQRLVD